MSLETVSTKEAYLARALLFAAAHEDEKTRFTAMLEKFSKEKLEQCMSISSIRRRVNAGSIDGAITMKGGSRKGSGRKRLPDIVKGESRKKTMDRERVKISRGDEKCAEMNWISLTFKPGLTKLASKERAVNSIRILAAAVRVCFDTKIQGGSPIYKRGTDLSYVCDLVSVNPHYGNTTTGQQRRIVLPTAKQRQKENLEGPQHSSTHSYPRIPTHARTCTF